MSLSDKRRYWSSDELLKCDDAFVIIDETMYKTSHQYYEDKKSREVSNLSTIARKKQSRKKRKN